MDGETQPGGRPPAPGELALVQAFINSHYDLERERGADLLATADGVKQWFLARALMAPSARVSERDRQRAVSAREALRALARRDGSETFASQTLNEASRGAAVTLRFADERPEFVAANDGIDGALGVILARAAASMRDGSWQRLKVCPGQDCGWAFYDHSRNQTGRWCSMAVCGGRAKARSHYRRRRGEGPA